MPEATDIYSTDYYWYQYIVNPIAKNICFLSPNFITLLSTILIIPIVKNLLNNGKMSVFMGLMILRYFFDCLDGSIARKCDKKSKMGALFDILSDFMLFMSLNLIMVHNIISYKELNTKNIGLLGIIFAFILFLIKTNMAEIMDERSSSNNYFYWNFDKFAHDNGLIFYGLYAYLVKCFLQ